MKHYLRNFWNGFAILLFTGFVISMVVGTPQLEANHIMQQADLAALSN